MSLERRVIYVNPAYALEESWNSSEGIGGALKWLRESVQLRGCTLIALLPNLSHTDWYERHVDEAHEIHEITGGLIFPNPHFDFTSPKGGWLPLALSQLCDSRVAARSALAARACS